jgi:hypothetical protein
MRFLISTLFSSCITLMLLLQSCTGNSGDVSTVSATTSTDGQTAGARFVKQEIAPPFEKLDVKPTTLTLKNHKAQTLHLASGTSIDVPESAFVDAQGKPVSGKVDLLFREFHTAAEIMASGIPMKVFGENGEEGWMQTAGMYEINGFSEGKPVFVAPGKSLTVNLGSRVDGEYDFWRFDPENGNWDNYGVSNAVPNPARQASSEELQELQRSAGNPPAEPVAFRENTPPIDLNINLKNFPELKNKRGIVWQYAGKNAKEDPANNPNLFRQEWDNIELSANADGKSYQLTLSNDDQTVSLPVAPALKGKDLEQARADYQRQLAVYKKKLLDVDEKKAYLNNLAAFTRSFSIQGFGVYNYDILLKLGETIPLLANFDFGADVPKNLRSVVSVYLVTGSARTVVNFPPHDWKKFRFDANADNYLVAVLPGNKLATFSNEDFKRELPDMRTSKGNEYVFRMKVDKDEVKSVKEAEEKLIAL